MTDTTTAHHRDPLHGITLEKLLTELVDHFGWQELSKIIRIKCFTINPGIKSSLIFLRRTPWAREKTERLYLKMKRQAGKKGSGR